MALTKRETFDFTPDKFGERLRDIRKEDLKESQAEFARRLGIGKSSLCQYEKGDRKPDAEILRKMADALECTSDYLIGKEQAPTHENSDVCELTGLPAGAVEILHEAVENKTKCYKILIDLFQYLLHQDRVYLEKDINGEKVYYRKNTDTSALVNQIEGAVKSMEIHQRSYDNDFSEIPAEIDATKFLENQGYCVVSPYAARDYHLREAADLFRNVLLKFIEDVNEVEHEYSKKIWNPIIMHDGVEANISNTPLAETLRRIPEYNMPE